MFPFRANSIQRRNWIFTQLASSSQPLRESALGFQLGLSILTYDSFISNQASFFWDTKEIELGAKASGRIFQQIGVGRTALNNSLQNWTETFSVELARRFMSPEGRYGRLGLQYDWLSPSNEQFIQIAFDSGVLESASERGLIKIAFHYFYPLTPGLNTRLIASLDSGAVLNRWSKSNLKAGLQFGWTYHLTDEQDSAQINLAPDRFLSSEHMIFGFTPWIEYGSDRMITKLGVPVRLFMDKEWREQPMSTNITDKRKVTSYPLELNWADVWLSFVFLL